MLSLSQITTLTGARGNTRSSWSSSAPGNAVSSLGFLWGATAANADLRGFCGDANTHVKSRPRTHKGSAGRHSAVGAQGSYQLSYEDTRYALSEISGMQPCMFLDPGRLLL